MNALELPDNRVCSVARSLEVVGMKWTLLIVREILRGHTRFGDFRTRIGVPPDILTSRLNMLVREGLLERREYKDEGRRPREEYVLTSAGHDLLPVMAALVQWGDKHRPSPGGPTAYFVDDTTDSPVSLAFVGADGKIASSPAVRMNYFGPAGTKTDTTGGRRSSKNSSAITGHP